MGIAQDNPLAAADRKSLDDVTAQGSCPLTRTDIQLIPVRYAYVEDAVSDDSLDPGFADSFKAIGVRQARDGFLYVFHSSAPDILHEYRVSNGGAVEKRLWKGDDATQDQRDGIPDTPALVVPRSGHIDVVFSSTQLTAKKCSMLIAWQDYRQKVMRRISLSGMCAQTGSQNLLTKSQLENLLVHPVDSENGDDGTLGAWYWAQDSVESSREPFAHRLTAYENDHAYLIVDDLVGQLDDLVDAWRVVDTCQNDWLEREDARYYAASFINGMVELDDDRLTDLALSYSNAADDEDDAAALERIGDATTEQKARLKALVEGLDEHRMDELAVYSNPRGLPTSGAAQQQINLYNADIQSVAADLDVEPEHVARYVEAVSTYQQAVKNGAVTGERGVADFVRMDDMQDYWADAEQVQARFASEKTLIIEGLKALLDDFYLLGHLYDRQSQTAYMELLGLDNAIITVLSEYAQSTGDFSFLARYYFGDVGHQHLIAFKLDASLFTGPVSRVIGTFKSVLDARDGPQTHQQWLDALAENPQIRFPALAPETSAELSHRLASLSVIARQEMMSLVASATGARLHDRLEQLFNRMKPGLRAHLLDNQLLYKVDMKIADTDTLARLERAVSELEDLYDRYLEKQTAQTQLEKAHRRASTRERRRHQDQYETRVRQLRAEKQQAQVAFNRQAQTFQHLSPLEGESHSGALLVGGLSSTAEGRAVAAEMEELRALERRGGPAKLWDHARGLVHGSDSMEITKRIGGLGLVSFVGVIGAIGTADAFSKWWNGEKDGSLLDVAAAGFGTVGAAASVATVIGSARLNYYYQTIQPAESLLSRLARVNVWGGTIAAGSGFLAAGADGIKQFLQMVEAWKKGESWVGSGITMAGDTMIAGASARISSYGARGIYHILIRETAEVTWASVNRGMLAMAGGLFRGMNAWLWVGTALVLIGQWVHNRFQRTAVQAWCEQSVWGNESAGWDAERQRYELARRIYAPTLAVMAERDALGPTFSYLGLRIELPGSSTIDPDSVQWVVLARRGSAWEIDTGDWSERITVAASPTGVAALEAHLLPGELNAIDGLYVVLRYKPEGISEWLPEKHFHLELGERGNTPSVAANETKHWQAIAPMAAPDERLAALAVHPLPPIDTGDNA